MNKTVYPTPQVITPAMVQAPPKPVSPPWETATQRDVAVYILALRAWGNQMVLMLSNIEDLITEPAK